MTPCMSCSRYIRNDGDECPFCGTSSPVMMNLKRATVVALTPLFLAACYGGAPVPEGYEDFDGDGWMEVDDCDDNNAAVNPDADEVCDDDIDNNCDGVIDEEDCVEDDTSASE